MKRKDKKMKKRIISACLLAVTLLSSALPASASFGSGAAVIAADVTLVKSVLSGDKVTFRDSDFKAALGVTDFKSIKITCLPEENTGTLLYAGRRAELGQTVKRRSIPSLVFLPASESVTEARFKFTVKGLSDGKEIECIMRFTGAVNQAPVASSKSASAAAVQAGVGIGGRMTASDPEGDSLEYIIISYPRRGVLDVGADGSYFYTPSGDYKGKDAFTYIVRDEWGNWSEAVTVSFSVKERVSSTVFYDMQGRSEYSAALSVEALGIMSGVSEGTRLFFMPDKTVTRAEFVTSAMKAARIAPTEESSFFDDDSAIPSEYRSYVATAARLGIINGELGERGVVFKPNEPIARYEASWIVTALLGLTADEETAEFLSADGVPVWARGSVAVMYTLGLLDPEAGEETASLTRADAAAFLVKLNEII